MRSNFVLGLYCMPRERDIEALRRGRRIGDVGGNIAGRKMERNSSRASDGRLESGDARGERDSLSTEAEE